MQLRLLGSLGLIVLLMTSASVMAQVSRVGLVTDVGKVDDGTFNEFAYKGMMRAVEAFNLQSAFIETQQPTDYEKNIERLVAAGYEMIITVGFMLGDATKKMAQQYPQVRFAIVDFAYDPPLANVIGLVFAEEQAGFLAGALAGLMTSSKIVGVVAGVAIPPVIRFRKGYAVGVKHVCDCEVMGVYIDSFTDPVRGKTAALSQIDEGADVVFGGGGITGSGAILGAAQAGAWVIGVDQDEYLTTFKQGRAPGAHKLLSSAMKRVDNAVYGAIERAVEGAFTGGTQMFDARNDGVGLAPFHDAEGDIPEAVKTRIQKITADLRSGQLTVKTED
jgi:basic membrane lipoprotein Med (substrate-binding protein (PBP1-ABC) superfamily)